jgi:hypothetical protein
MAATKQLISTVTVGSGGAANITFSSIPATYTDLLVKISVRNSSGGAVASYIALNGSTSNFSARYLYGSGSSTSSGTLARYIGSTKSDATANTFNSTDIYIPNYAGSTNKSYSVDNVDENNGTAADQNIIAGLWSDTAAITSIALTSATGDWVQYSTASLYGITKGDGGATVS